MLIPGNLYRINSKVYLVNKGIYGLDFYGFKHYSNFIDSKNKHLNYFFIRNNSILTFIDTIKIKNYNVTYDSLMFLYCNKFIATRDSVELTYHCFIQTNE